VGVKKGEEEQECVRERGRASERRGKREKKGGKEKKKKKKSSRREREIHMRMRQGLGEVGERLGGCPSKGIESDKTIRNEQIDIAQWNK
jgi:hypothetical protein